MEMCPFLSNPVWRRNEAGIETLEIKEVPCQKEKCFLYREGKCGAVYRPDYSDIKNTIGEINVGLNENMKALYDLIKENSEKNMSLLSELNQRIVPLFDNLKNVFEQSFRGIQDEVSKLMSQLTEITYRTDEQRKKEFDEIKSSFERVITESEENIKKILDVFVEERDKFLKNFEGVFEKIISTEKEQFENISQKSISYIEGIKEEADKRFSEIFEVIQKERILLGELFEKIRNLTESMISYKKEIEKTLEEEKIKRKFENARFLYLKGEYTEAEKILKEIVEKGEFDDASLLLGLVLLGSKRFDEAEPYLKNYLEKHPEVPEALTGLGRILFEKGDYQNALLLLEKAKEKSPDSEDILYIYGLSLARTGRIDEAREIFEKILEINPYFEPAKEAIKKYISPID